MSKRLSRATLLTIVAFIACLLIALPRVAAAQDQNQDSSQQPAQVQAQIQAQIVDPPTRVARLNYVQGAVSFQPAGEQDWLEADINRPLTTGDNLWADKDSRGEIHIGATSIRLSSDTGISFLNLDDRTVQLQLAQGTIEVHLRRLEPGNAFEIDTPNLAFTLVASGEYRIQAKRALSPDKSRNRTSPVLELRVSGKCVYQELLIGGKLSVGAAHRAPTIQPHPNVLLQPDRVEVVNHIYDCE